MWMMPSPWVWMPVVSSAESVTGDWNASQTYTP